MISIKIKIKILFHIFMNKNAFYILLNRCDFKPVISEATKGEFSPKPTASKQKGNEALWV